MNMPSELKEAVAQGLPVELTDGPNRYMVVQAEVYERLMATLDFSELTADEKRAQLQAMGRAAGWEDPEAAVFDDLEPQ
jgi:hypothetical protein